MAPRSPESGHYQVHLLLLNLHGSLVCSTRSSPVDIDAKTTCSLREVVCTTAGVSFYSE